MTLAGVALALACWSLAVMLDMADPWLNSGPIYTPVTGFSVLPPWDQIDAWGLIGVTKKRAGSPRLALPRILLGPIRGAPRSGSRHQHGIDHMDHAVGLIDVRDRDHRGSALGVDAPDLAAVVLHGQLFAFGGLELHAVLEVGRGEFARHDMVGQDLGQGRLV